MSDRNGMSLSFVGTTNPVLGWRRLIDGVRRLVGQADADLVVANTSGLLAGPGRRLKAAKIAAIRPDLLIALGHGRDLEAILRDHRGTAILPLPPSPHARRKTDGERRRARRDAFRRYFAEARLQTVERGMLPPAGTVDSLPSGLLLGLSDERGCEQGLGILAGSSTETVDILTPVAGCGIGRITPGSLRLDEDFRETHEV
jgi:polynucleotide 5'-hydroxyl-kinase GRC3/NOL9